APEAIRVLAEIGSGYSNLEYDLATGGRGHRGTYVENALALLCGGEAATVVNNCAAALVLVVQHFTASGRARPQLARRVGGEPPKDEIIISRGELVQIGGGFRIGEMIEATGANLREVGATNKTTLDDYRRAIGFRSAMILKVRFCGVAVCGGNRSARTEKADPFCGGFRQRRRRSDRAIWNRRTRADAPRSAESGSGSCLL
ncbi:MAG: hypothetical protein DME48_01605, partial [Verrucomicrobia bacterium]